MKCLARALLAVSLVAVLSHEAPAQQYKDGVLVVITQELRGSTRLGLALRHAVDLKRAGFNVEILFQYQGVVSLASLSKAASGTAGFQELAAGEQGGVSSEGAGRQDPPASEELRSLFSQLKDLKIPYSACVFFAARLNVLKQLRAQGEPLSGDEGKMVSLAPYLKAGYKVIFI